MAEKGLRYEITTREEYDMLIARGIDPFFGRWFYIEENLRRAILKEKFPKNTEENNIKFYHWVWEGRKQHYCSECMRPLERYSSSYVSHRFSRGSHAEMAYDPRNTDILCQRCHNKWENPITREKMKIFPKAKKEMEELNKTYQKLMKYGKD